MVIVTSFVVGMVVGGWIGWTVRNYMLSIQDLEERASESSD